MQKILRLLQLLNPREKHTILCYLKTQNLQLTKKSKYSLTAATKVLATCTQTVLFQRKNLRKIY